MHHSLDRKLLATSHMSVLLLTEYERARAAYDIMGSCPRATRCVRFGGACDSVIQHQR